MSVQVFTLPPLPAVSQPGPLSLELRVASGVRDPQGLVWLLGVGLCSLLGNKGVNPTTASLPRSGLDGTVMKNAFSLSTCLFLL